jgi:5-methylcytosine-specific restriction endonuclease McrA
MEKHYSIETVFNMLGEEALNIKTQPTHTKESIEVEGFKVYKKSLRYATFYQKGCECVVCGKKGTYFKLDADRDGGNIEGRRHFNLYAEDDTLMTKDHILPRKWGGKDHIDNLQTMCAICNENKGSQYELEVDGIIATDIQNPENVKKYTNFEECVARMFEFRNIKVTQKMKRGTIVRIACDMTLKIQEALRTGEPYMNYIFKYAKFKVEGASYNKENS